MTQTTQIIRKGWITKQGPPPWKSWKKRWCELTMNYFIYYKPARNRPKAQLKGKILVSSISDIVEQPRTKKGHIFIIDTPTRKFNFAAEDAKSLKDWLAALKLAQEKNTQMKRLKRAGKKWSGLEEGDASNGGQLSPIERRHTDITTTMKRSSLPLDEQIKLMSKEELKKKHSGLDGQMKAEIELCRKKYLAECEKLIDEIVKKEIEAVVESYDQERRILQRALCEKGGKYSNADFKSVKKSYRSNKRASVRRTFRKK